MDSSTSSAPKILPVPLEPGPFRLQRDAIERAVAEVLHPGEKGALIVEGGTAGGAPEVRVAIAHRLGNGGFQWMGEVVFDGDFSGKVSLLKTWR